MFAKFIFVINLLCPQDGPGLYRRDILADREPAQELLDLRARCQALGREVVKSRGKREEGGGVDKVEG